MDKSTAVVFAGLLAMLPPAVSAATAVDGLLERYRGQGGEAFSAAAGKAFWNRAFTPPGAADARRCASCHTDDPGKPGRHLRTGKPIEPLAPSVNPQRLGDVRNIEKWFKRNCEWTVGRTCTAQEKGDVLIYLRTR
jgi:mono/diheme cytochrome c family protein